MSTIVYLNGNFVPKEKAYISPEDRGFNFADGVYEVVKYYRGKPFRMKDHLDRLKFSLAEVGIPYREVDQLEEVFSELLAANGLSSEDSGVYLQISRGAHQRVHHFPLEIAPTVYAFAFPFPSFTDCLQNGIKVITREDIRWLRCDIKSVSLLPNTMLYNQAVKLGAGECILIRNGKVTEATHSSVFGIKNGRVITHPLSNLILPGITRKVVLELCAENGIEFMEVPVELKQLCELDEIFIAGTGSEIMPVTEVDNTFIGNGTPGPLTKRLQQLFFEATV